MRLLPALAQFKREVIRERTVVGLSAAGTRGRKGGRPSVMTPEKMQAARRVYDEREHAVEQIARILGVSRTSIYRALGAAPSSEPNSQHSAASPPRSRDGGATGGGGARRLS